MAISAALRVYQECRQIISALMVLKKVSIAALATSLNTRPRKTLGWKTPAEALDQYLLSDIPQPVATIV
jgi:hypothetical protein